MVAYAKYLNDARIKAYVKSLEQSGATVDILAVREPGKSRLERIGATRVFHLTSQYQGDSAIRYLWSYCQFWLVALIALSYLSIRVRYRAIHVHNMPNVLVFTAVVPKLLGAKIILDVHDLMAPNYMAKFHASADHLVVKCLVLEQRISALLASQVLCADHSQKEYLETVCRIPVKKIAVMLNLPNEDIFERLEHVKSEDRFELVYHGTIARRLGIDILLEAIARVPEDVPVRLSIFGAGDFLPDALDLARQLHLADRVYFSGSFFPVEMISEMVGNRDLGVIGNRRTLACDKFMLPVKLLEYVYLGIPVVAPRLEIISRYFDESMVKYYEPESIDDLTRCIVELYRCPTERQRMAASASTFYQQHNWRQQAQVYVSLLSA